MELSYCERGHYAEKMTSGRCKDCIEEYNEEFLSSLDSLEKKSRKREWNEQRNAYLTEDNFQSSIKHRNKLAKYRFSKLGFEDAGEFTAQEIQDLLVKQSNECVGCLTSFDEVAFVIDHKIPLGSITSSNKIKNLQLLCNACNVSKGTNSNDTFISEMRYKQVMQYLFELQEEESYAT